MPKLDGQQLLERMRKVMMDEGTPKAAYEALATLIIEMCLNFGITKEEFLKDAENWYTEGQTMIGESTSNKLN